MNLFELEALSLRARQMASALHELMPASYHQLTLLPAQDGFIADIHGTTIIITGPITPNLLLNSFPLFSVDTEAADKFSYLINEVLHWL